MNKKNYFSILFIIVVSIFSTFGFSEHASASASAMTLPTRNNNIVQVAPYGTANDADISLGTQDSAITLMSWNHASRIRQNGTVTQLKMYLASMTGWTSLKVGFWRFNGSTYTLVGVTEDLLTHNITGDSVNTFVLNTPIAGIQEGDYYGIFGQGGTMTGGPMIQSGVADSYVLYWVPAVGGSAPSETVNGTYNWEAQLTDAEHGPFTGYAFNVEIYMQAPHFVMIGDSLTASGVVGSGVTHHSFAERFDESDNTALGNHWTNISQTWEYKLAATTPGLTYQNMGIGGTTTQMTASRFDSDVVELHPKIVTIMVGINDIYLGNDESAFLSDMRSMLDSAVSHDITPWVMAITPANGLTNLQSQTEDTWNTDLEALVLTYPTAVFIPNKTYMGEFRVGGDPGNLWDLKPEALSTNDGGWLLHWSATGTTYFKNSIFDAITVATHTIGGNITGLIGTVVLQNNTGDNLDISANGSFTFSTAMDNGSAYSVSVLTQPSNQHCTVSNGSGFVPVRNITNISVVCADNVPPVVDSFVMPASSSSITVQITNFTASDNIGVVGYLVNESASTPSAGNAGWSGSAPTTFKFSDLGNKTAYAWAKDAAGNISLSVSATVSIGVSNVIVPAVIAPVVNSSSSNDSNNSHKEKKVTLKQKIKSTKKWVKRQGVTVSSNFAISPKGNNIGFIQNILKKTGLIKLGNITSRGYRNLTQGAATQLQKFRTAFVWNSWIAFRGLFKW